MGQDWGREWPHHSQKWQRPAPSLAWDIHRGPVDNNVTATSSALAQVDASFIHKHEDVRGLVSFQCHYSLQ